MAKEEEGIQDLETSSQHILDDSPHDVLDNITGGQEPEQEQGVDPNQAPAEAAPPDFDPNSWKLNYKGQDQFPKDREHLVNLAQKGFGYERAMEDLNKERAQLTSTQQQYERYAGLDKAFQAHPQLAQTVWDMANKYASGQVPQQGENGEYEEPDPQVLAVKNELEELKQWKNTLVEQKAQQDLEAEANEVMKQYPDHNWQADDGTGTLIQKLYRHCYDNNIPNLQLAYKDFFWNSTVQNSKASALKQEQERRQQEHRTGVVNSGSQPSGPANTGNAYTRGDSYNDLVDKATQEFGG